VDEDAQSREITVDLERRTVTAGPVEVSFNLDEEMRQRLLRGLSPIDVTLKRRADIEKFFAADRTARPWIHSFGDQGTGEP
jgi:3-isopropylmalate/(R)-2-methylmalate dehydratase small subunit